MLNILLVLAVLVVLVGCLIVVAGCRALVFGHGTNQMEYVRFTGKVVRDARIGVYIDIGAEKAGVQGKTLENLISQGQSLLVACLETGCAVASKHGSQSEEPSGNFSDSDSFWKMPSKTAHFLLCDQASWQGQRYRYMIMIMII